MHRVKIEIRAYTHKDGSVSLLGTPRGDSLLDLSIEEFGFRDAGGVLDKNGKLIGGNHRTKAARQHGIEEALIIRTTKDKPVYIQYEDLDLDNPDDPTARKLAYMLNRSAQVSITFDPAVLADDIESGLNLSTMFTKTELKQALQLEVRPDRFKDVTEIPTDFCCPKCKFEWSGSPKPQ